MALDWGLVARQKQLFHVLTRTAATAVNVRLATISLTECAKVTLSLQM